MTQQDISEWWELIQPALLRYARKFTHDPDKAQDLVQQVALAILVKKKSFHDLEHMKGWSFQKLKWFGLDALRMSKRESGIFTSDATVLDHLSSKETQEIDQAASELHQEIAKLPDRQKKAVEQRYIEGISTPEIARNLHVKEATVRSLLRHARSTLVERMDNNSQENI